MTDERYLRRVAEIRHQMDGAVDAWCLEKTNALLVALERSGEESTAL